MTKNFYYDDVKLIKKPLRKRLKRVLIFFVFFIFCVGIVFASYLLSSALTVGNISNVLVYGGKDIEVKKRDMYAVSMGNYTSRSEAEGVALGLTIQGGGGYIWREDDNYYVLGSVYSDSNSASAVAENLASSKYQVSVLKITMPKVALNFDNKENKSVSVIRDAIDFFEKTYLKIYDYAIMFDKSEINNLAISSYLSEMRGQVKVYISSIQSLISVDDGGLQEIQNGLIKFDELLDQAIIKTIDNSSTSSYLKYTLCSLTQIEYDMRVSLAG